MYEENGIIILQEYNIDAYIDDMIAIENASFARPWSRKAYLEEAKRNELAHYTGYFENNRLLGYGGFWLILDEGHISNIAVHPSYRGRGIGRQIVQALTLLCLAVGGKRMTLEVRVSNTAAIHLYEQIGFKSVGIRKGFYTDNNEDAYIMWLGLSDMVLGEN
jgi:ribosomal-protein-alanine N-acetyltransferase